MDPVVTSLSEIPRILFTFGDRANHWLLIQARGYKSLRYPSRAAFDVTTDSGRVPYNQYSASIGFMSTGDRRVHFSLGAGDPIAAIEIKGPSGMVQTLKDAKPQRILQVEEPH